MNEDEIMQTISRVASEVFGREITFQRESSAADVPEWDSLENFRFLVSVEQAFNVKISGAEASTLRNIGEFADLLSRLIESDRATNA